MTPQNPRDASVLPGNQVYGPTRCNLPPPLAELVSPGVIFETSMPWSFHLNRMESHQPLRFASWIAPCRSNQESAADIMQRLFSVQLLPSRHS